MSQESKNASRSRGKSIRAKDILAAHFRFFAKVKSADSSPSYAPVFLNVYDLTPINGYMYWAGLGIYHTGVEVHGAEYAFGAHDFPASGVFEVEPRQCPGFKFRKSIFMGITYLDPREVREFMEQQSGNYYGDMYHLIIKNCNHFSDDICYKLTGKRIPKWVNRLARIGSVCSCVLPESLKATAVPKEPQFYDDEKRQGRTFSCISPFAMPDKGESVSPLLLHSRCRACLLVEPRIICRPGCFEEEG